MKLQTKTWYGGSQYYQVIKFLGDEAQTAHKDRQSTSSQQSGQTTDVMKNIYDLEGNFQEWTQEAGSAAGRSCFGNDCDGASRGYWLPASSWDVNNPYDTYGCHSSRPALYVTL